MANTDKLKHVLLAMSIYDEEAFEDEITELANCINNDLPYDLDPGLHKSDLVEMVNNLIDTMDKGDIQERVMRFMVRKILLKEQEE